MNKPIFLDVYESKECEGVLSSYLVKEEIGEIISKMMETYEKLYNLLEIPSNFTIVSGGCCNGSGNTADTGTSNVTWETLPGGCCQGGQEHLPEGAVILPAHKMTCGCSDGSPKFEHNIYHPCLRDAGYGETTTFQTGKYPGDVDTYPTMKSFQVGMDVNNSMCNCHKDNSICTMNQKASTLKDILMNRWILGVQYIQVSNLIHALIQSNKIPMNPALVTTIEKVLCTILNNPDLSKNVERFGVYTETKHTISSPHNVCCQRVFVQTTNSGMISTIEAYVKSALTDSTESIPVAILSERDYATLQQYYPINVAFKCQMNSYPKHNITYNLQELEMILVNENRFIPLVTIKLNESENVHAMSPARLLNVSAGTSGRISFEIVARGTTETWVADRVYVNHHGYLVENLLGENAVQEYEYSGLRAEVTRSMYSLPDAKNISSQILNLDYVNLTSDIEIGVSAMKVEPTTKFDFDYDNISGVVGYLYPSSLNPDSKLVHRALSAVVTMRIPFSGICTDWRTGSALYTATRIYRNADGEIESYKDLTKFFTASLEYEKEGGLTKERRLDITSVLLTQGDAEFQITIPRGSLYVHSLMQGGRPIICTNDDLSFRFYVGGTVKDWEEQTLHFGVLKGDELPPVFEDETSNTPEDGDEPPSQPETPPTTEGPDGDNATEKTDEEDSTQMEGTPDETP